MTYEVVNKFVKYNPTSTQVQIKCDNPYTFITRDLMGDRMGTDNNQLIKEVLEMFATEVNPSGEIQKLKEELSELSTKTNAIVKSVMHVSELTDDVKQDIINSYVPYAVDTLYKAGEIFSYQGKLYRVVQEHRSQSDWSPASNPALYTEYLNFTTTVEGENGEQVEVEVINDYVQPTGAHDAYKKGDKIRFDGVVYESLADNNVYSPTAYAQNWKLIG